MHQASAPPAQARSLSMRAQGRHTETVEITSSSTDMPNTGKSTIFHLDQHIFRSSHLFNFQPENLTKQSKALKIYEKNLLPAIWPKKISGSSGKLADRIRSHSECAAHLQWRANAQLHG